MPNDAMRRTWTTGADGWVDNEALLAALLDEVRDDLRRRQADAATLTHVAAVWVATGTT